MKLVEAIEGGYQKTLVEGTESKIESYLACIESAKNQNLIGDLNVLAVLKELGSYYDPSSPTFAHGIEEYTDLAYRIQGMLAAVQGIKGKVEVVE